MNAEPTGYVNPQSDPISAENAWLLWHQLNRLAESIWELYEKQFREFCIQDAKDQCYIKPLPFD